MTSPDSQQPSSPIPPTEVTAEIRQHPNYIRLVHGTRVLPFSELAIEHLLATDQISPGQRPNLVGSMGYRRSDGNIELFVDGGFQNMRFPNNFQGVLQ